ncbi:MAG: D-aminoacyl-tRNA deacylase [Bacteroidales bacterium]|nr:D-aminoacyl-tRNA deacylase [Bacteroidales bacterium]MDZ4204046.1 D-aminoacyl-tRNA deacylase [Bacteroidales bacterium]
MRVVIQRVKEASVIIENRIAGKIGKGMLVLLGIEETDGQQDVEWLCGKISRLRIFNDASGVMNLDLAETGGEILIVSQFTLHGSTRKGNRPSYIKAAKPETAIPLYEIFKSTLSALLSKPIESGEFGAMMDVYLINDGPVTILIDSKTKE